MTTPTSPLRSPPLPERTSAAAHARTPAAPPSLGRSFARVLLAAGPRVGPDRAGRALPPERLAGSLAPLVPDARTPRQAEPQVPTELERHAGGRADGLPVDDDAPIDDAELDLLDPALRRAASLAPPPVLAPPAPAAHTPVEEVAPRARVSMEELLPQLVRRIAWAGDRRKGTVQLELGAGRHAGTTITVHADEGRVRVELDGVDVDELRSRIHARLRRQGIELDTT